MRTVNLQELWEIIKQNPEKRICFAYEKPKSIRDLEITVKNSPGFWTWDCEKDEIWNNEKKQYELCPMEWGWMDSNMGERTKKERLKAKVYLMETIDDILQLDFEDAEENNFTPEHAQELIKRIEAP